MFGLVSGQRRYSLSETTLQQGNFRGMVHNSSCSYSQQILISNLFIFDTSYLDLLYLTDFICHI